MENKARFKEVPISSLPTDVIAAVGTICNWLHFSKSVEMKLVLVSDETVPPVVRLR